MNLKLGTHQRFESKKSIYSYNTLSLVITMAQNSQKNFELDFELFAGSVKREGQCTELHR